MPSKDATQEVRKSTHREQQQQQQVTKQKQTLKVIKLKQCILDDAFKILRHHVHMMELISMVE